MEIREDSWLSERFGHPVFTVRSAEGLGEHAAARGRASYQARVDASDTEAVAALEAAGMRVVNVTLTLAADPAKPLPPAPVEVRTADFERDQPLLDVAGRTFRYTRFHLDPEVPQEVADRIKRDWVWSYLHGKRGDELLVAVNGGAPVGFLCVLGNVIDLMGVDPDARRTGAGRALVRAFHARSAGRYDSVKAGTQVANTPAIAFYEGLGYGAARAAYDLHMHVS